MIGKIFHSIANRTAALSMKLLFGYSSRIYVVGCEHMNRAGGFLLASNHISHFDPLIISSVSRRTSPPRSLVRSLLRTTTPNS